MSHLFQILQASHRLKTFSADTRGNFAVIVALLLVPILGLASLGLEQMQVSSFRQKLSDIAEAGARAGAEMDEKLPERRRQQDTVAHLHKLISMARLKPADIGMRVDFASSTLTEGVTVTVALEANTPLAVTLMPGHVRRIRVVANSGDAVLAASERMIHCHAAATQSDYDLLDC